MKMPLQILPKFWQNCSGSRSQKVKFSHKKTGKNFVSGLLWGYLYYSTVVPHIFLLENILDRELLSLSRVEWFSTSFFLKTYTFLLIRYIFRNSIPKNRQFRLRARIACAAQFSFSKITGTIYFFIWTFAQTFRIHQRTIYKIKFEKYFCFIHITFYFPKMEKQFLIMYKVKINSFLNLSPFLAFK